jgi:Mlc titration factor MtfA (ptsG expression regulator)
MLGPLRWWRERRRARRLDAPIRPAVQRSVDELPFAVRLTAGERAELLRITRVLLAEKTWEGCAGLELTLEMRAVIAAQAAVLVLHRPACERSYPGLESILVYPHAFVNPLPQVDAAGVVTVGRANHGEAWHRGPVVLDWDEARRGVARPADGRNLVFHEFAHKLDLLDGVADGRPPLADGSEPQRYRDVMLRVYEDLCAAATAGRPTLLDHYGARNPAEFFAVATEAFFERGAALRRARPQLYEVLRACYRQDPAG